MKKILTLLQDTLKRWFHESAEISFSGCHNTENLLTRSSVPLKRGFLDWVKTHFQASKMWNSPQSLQGTLKQLFHESAEIAFSGCENAENLFTRNLVPLKLGFHDCAKSHFQASKMRKFPHSLRGTLKL